MSVRDTKRGHHTYWDLSETTIRRAHTRWRQGEGARAIVRRLRTHARPTRGERLTWAEVRSMWAHLSLSVVEAMDSDRMRAIHTAALRALQHRYHVSHLALTTAALHYCISNDVDLGAHLIEQLHAREAIPAGSVYKVAWNKCGTCALLVAPNARYCCAHCRRLGKNRERRVRVVGDFEKKCVVCNRSFTSTRRNAKYCRPSCVEEARVATKRALFAAVEASQ